MKVNSIKFEISVFYTAVLGVILLIFSIVLFIIFDAFYAHIDRQLESKAHEISQTIRAYMDVLGDTPEALPTAVKKTISLKSESLFQFKSKKISEQWLKRAQDLDLNKDYIRFLSINNKSPAIARSENFPEDLEGIFSKNAKLGNGYASTIKRLAYKKKAIRLINYPYIYQGKRIYIIQVGIYPGQVTSLMQKWFYSIAIGIPLILILTAFMGRIIAARILKPVEEITAMARKITYEDLSTRVRTKHFDEEMQDLVDAFNEMISRLETSFDHIEEFSSHVAHELKTPLTIIRGESELALKKDRSPAEYKVALKIIIEEVHRMLKTIEDLLLLTRLNYQPEVFEFKPIDFVEFFKEIYEQSKILAFKKNIHIKLHLVSHKSLMIMADSLHLRRLFFNLIDNAIKFTPDDGVISFNVSNNVESIIIHIADSGKGIPEEDIPKIFNRFYKGSGGSAGNGLGLNIAKSIAEIHHGKISVQSKLSAGTTFCVELPLS